jgi:WD40 repeat protein
MTETADSVEPRSSPYFGLDYYREKFGSWFFGRETDGGKIITNLRAARLTLLHAESGVGKSSLLRAGVAWRMEKLAHDSLARRGTPRFIPVVFSSWKDDPVRELTGTIRETIGPYLTGGPPPELPSDRLGAAIEAASGAVNASLLIMLDQFEEYFLYRSGEPVPERFADELADCINRPGLRANFLIAIREDAYAGLGDLFKGRIANVYGNYLHIDYLDRAAAEKAIRAPIEVYNRQPGSDQVVIQNELVEAVLDQVRAFDGGDALQVRPTAGGNGDRVATPLLQLAMETVWERERAQGSRELRLSTLQELHGVKMIVDDHLGKALGALGNGERQAAIDMFDHLVTPSGGKIAETVPDLALRTGRSEAQVGAVLEKLDHERIVRPVPAAPGHDPMRFRRYEIFHDVLAPTINRAIVAREERRRVRRLQRLAALALGLVIVALGITGGFAYLVHTADNEKQTAESRELAADADVNLAHDPELSALLALQALHVHYTSQAEDALRTAIPDLQAVRTLSNGTAVYAAVIDPVNPDEVASGGQSGVTSIWDVKTGAQLARLAPPGGYTVTGTASTVAFNPAGTEVAVGYGGGTVALFDVRSGQELRSATVTGSPAINAVEFLGGPGELAIAASDGVFLWPLSNGGQCCQSLSSADANSISADPRDPLKFAVGTPYGTYVWDLAGKPQSHRVSQYRVNGVAFSPDGTEVAEADTDGYVSVYNVATRKEVMLLSADESATWRVAFSPQGLIVAGYASGTARVWDASTGVQLTVLAGSASGVDAAGFSSDGSQVVTASEDGTIRVWHAQPRELRQEFTDSYAGGSTGPIDGASYLEDGRIAALGSSGRVYVFNPADGQRTGLNPGTAVASMAWDRAGTQIVTVGFNGPVVLWRATGTGYAQVTLPSPIHVSEALNVGMSWDGSRVAIETGYYTIQVWSTRTGQLLQTIKSANSLYRIAFSPDGRQILGADYDGQLQVWYVGGNRTRMLGSPAPALNSIGYDKIGNEFVTAAESGAVTVWAAPGNRPVRTIDACSSPEMAALSPDGLKVVVACGDGSVPVYDADTGQRLTELPAAIEGGVVFAAFSSDGKSIVTTVDAGYNGCVQVWSAALATPSLQAIEQTAKQRITRTLTPAEQREYLSGSAG